MFIISRDALQAPALLLSEQAVTFDFPKWHLDHHKVALCLSPASTSQRMIQIYHPLYLIEMIVCFRQFSGEQGLLSGKHFQIGGATAVFHQLASTFHGAAQGGYLLAIKLQTAVGCLPLCKSIVHFAARFQQTLLERE